MTCYHPLRGFVIGEKENGKKDLVIKSSSIDYIWRRIGTSSKELLVHMTYLLK